MYMNTHKQRYDMGKKLRHRKAKSYPGSHSSAGAELSLNPHQPSLRDCASRGRGTPLSPSRRELGRESSGWEGANAPLSSSHHFQSPAMLPEDKPSVTREKSPLGSPRAGGKAGLAPA